MARRARGAAVSETIRLLIADDQRVVRDGLSLLARTLEGVDVDVVGVAANGAEAVEQARERRPDVVLMDLAMPVMNGTEATRAILAELPATAVLVLTTYADDDALFPALEAGARGYLTKDASAEEIEDAIDAVHAGRLHLDPAVQQRVVDAAVASRAPASAASAPPDDLTTREVEVLALIAGGLSNREIAERLVVSGATVKTHVNRLFMKTGARDRAQAVRYAYEHGLA
jgi:DNA-binding NarL/FixJ family response regulator